MSKMKYVKIEAIVYSGNSIMIQDLSGFVPSDYNSTLRIPTKDELIKILEAVQNTELVKDQTSKNCLENKNYE